MSQLFPRPLAGSVQLFTGTLQLNTTGAAGTQYGLHVIGTTSNAADILANFAVSGVSTPFTVYADGHGVLGYNGTSSTISFSANGSVAVASPASGGHFVDGANGAATLALQNATGADGRSVLRFVNPANTKTWDVGVDTSGGATLGWSVHDITRGATPLTVNTNGDVIIAAPNGTDALNVTGAANQYTAEFIAGTNTALKDVLHIAGSTATGFSGGLFIESGTNSSDRAVYIRGASGNPNFFEILGDGSGGLGATSSSTYPFGWSAAGNFTLGAPTSGTTLTVSAVSGATAINMNGSASAASLEITSGAGYLFNTNLLPALAMNSSGADDGFLQNDAANLWSLAYGSALTSLGTPCLQWDANSEVGIATPSTIGNLGSGITQAGYMDEPQNLQNATYSLALTDRGKQLYHTSATAHTWTIPANSSVAFPVGTIIRLINDSGGGNVTIAITTDTLVWFPSGTTGSRTLAALGACTIEKVTSTRWVITGVNLT